MPADAQMPADASAETGPAGGLLPLDPSAVDPVAAIAACALFGVLDSAALAEVARAFEWGVIHGGTNLMCEGDPGDSLYVVVTGKLKVVVRDPAGGERAVAEVGRGGNVGEMSLLTGAPRSATVRAVRDTVVGRLSRVRFEELLRAYPDAVLTLTRMLATWLTESNRTAASEEVPATLALVGARDIPLQTVARQLHAALQSIGPTRLLDASEVERVLGPGAADATEDSSHHGRVSQWLYEQEARHQHILYVADPERSAWSLRCLRQADRVVTVVSTMPGAARPHGYEPARLADSKELLLVLHPTDAASPSETARFTPERFDGHHHVRHDNRADYARLARHLTGRAVGLVLGGGGARGFAHIGAIAALRETGVPIDAVGGASMGAVIAALCALELPDDEIVRRSRLWGRYRPHSDYTAPFVALLSGRRGRAMLREMFGDTCMEDLWLPYFAVSADITSAREVIHRHGRLAHWLSATIAIPGIVPPLAGEGDQLLVDGGVLNNVPVDVMRRQTGGPTVAVDVSARDDFSLADWKGVVPGATDVLRDRILPGGRRKPYPSLFYVLARASTLGSAVRTEEARAAADLYLEPPVEGFELFGWAGLDRLVAVGYEYTITQLASWDGATRRSMTESVDQ
jgi:predicted acylesterase/phospholipase RssA/CRP-like cAMP-binding protein